MYLRTDDGAAAWLVFDDDGLPHGFCHERTRLLAIVSYGCLEKTERSGGLASPGYSARAGMVKEDCKAVANVSNQTSFPESLSADPHVALSRIPGLSRETGTERLYGGRSQLIRGQFHLLEQIRAMLEGPGR